MLNLKFSIRPYHEGYRDQLLLLWEKSVLTTHHFLEKEDFEAIKKMVSNINFQEFSVFCLLDKNEQVMGFLGLVEKKIEMLFLNPVWFGKGLGKVLLDYAIDNCGCSEVDVNEQNVHARIFYEKAGFEVVARSEKDEAGMNYPILHMKFKQNL